MEISLNYLLSGLIGAGLLLITSLILIFVFKEPLGPVISKFLLNKATEDIADLAYVEYVKKVGNSAATEHMKTIETLTEQLGKSVPADFATLKEVLESLNTLAQKVDGIANTPVVDKVAKPAKPRKQKDSVGTNPEL